LNPGFGVVILKWFNSKLLYINQFIQFKIYYKNVTFNNQALKNWS